MKLAYLLLFISTIWQVFNQQGGGPVVINVSLNNKGELTQMISPITFPTITSAQASLSILKDRQFQQMPGLTQSSQTSSTNSGVNSLQSSNQDSAIQAILRRAQQVPGT